MAVKLKKAVIPRQVLATLALGLVFVTSTVIGFLPAHSSAAPTAAVTTTYDWVNKATIQASNWKTTNGYVDITFVDSVPTDANRTFVSSFVSTAGGQSCTGDTLVISSAGGGDNSKATLTTYTAQAGRGTLKGSCVKSTDPVTLGSVDNALNDPTANGQALGSYSGDSFAWVNTTTLAATGPKPATFTGASGIYKASGTAICPDQVSVELSSATGNTATGTLSPQKRTGTGGSTCATDGSPVSITIGNTAAGPALYTAAGATAQDPPSCENSGGPLSWIMCDVIKELASAVDGVYDNLMQPLLKTAPLDFSSGSANFQAWSNVRVYGDIFLVIALLIVVFGQSIGGGIIEAYTAKKILPKLLIAAVLINLSIYLVALVIDVSNIIGGGIASLLLTPFHLQDAFVLTHQTATGTITTGLGAVALVGGTAIWGFLNGGLVEVLIFTVLIPILLTFLAIMVTLLVRLALITVLTIFSPVAFAFYCLPNTEQYFRKWWDLLVKTLMIYPIVAVLFAMGKVLSFTISSTTLPAVAAPLRPIMEMVALVIPLIGIPFAFQLAGGILGRVHELSQGARQKIHNTGMLASRRERAKQNFTNRALQTRQDRYQNLQTAGSTGGALKRRTYGLAARALGGYNIEGQASAARAQVNKEVNDMIATGRDEEARGLSINKQWALSTNNIVKWNAANNRWEMPDGSEADTQAQQDAQVRVDKQGARQFKSLGGAWINEADVDAGHRRWGKNSFAQQASLAYEMRKATTEDQAQNIAENYRNVATGAGGWGNTEQQLVGSWVGASFENQNQHLAFKYTDQTSTGRGTMTAAKASGFVDEIYEKKGSYSLAQMDSHTIEQLKVAHNSADLVVNGRDENGNAKTYTTDQVAAARDQRQKIAAISETFMHEMGGGQIGSTGGDHDVPIINPDGTPGKRQANTPGAAHVAERVRELANLTGVYPAAPTGYYGPGHQPNTPSPNRREQS